MIGLTKLSSITYVICLLLKDKNRRRKRAIGQEKKIILYTV